jgi:MinD superfamily P-loop ATPase
MEIAFLSGKGGTGKSSICSAFISLANNVVAVDSDVDAANLHLIFKTNDASQTNYISGKNAVINPDFCIKCGLCKILCQFDAINFINGNYQIDPVSCDGCAICYRKCPSNAIGMIHSDESKLYVGDFEYGLLVYGQLAPGEENSGKFISVIRNIAKEKASEKGIDKIIIDGPPGIGCPFMSTITGVDKVVLVTEPSKSALMDLKRALDVAREYLKQIYVIINKFDLNNEISNEIQFYCDKLKIPIVAKIPFDKEIVYAMVNKQTIIEYNKNSKIVGILKDAYEYILNK